MVPVSEEGGGVSSTWRTLSGVAISVLVFSVLFGGYHASRFLILLSAHAFHADWIKTGNVIAWVLAALVLMVLFGGLRFVTSYISRLFRFIFKFAQSDVVTIVLAVGVNALFLVFGGWLTVQIITLIEVAPVDSFFKLTNFFSIAVMFCMLAGSLVWIPRLGLYGENQVGAALSEGERW